MGESESRLVVKRRLDISIKSVRASELIIEVLIVVTTCCDRTAGSSEGIRGSAGNGNKSINSNNHK